MNTKDYLSQINRTNKQIINKTNDTKQLELLAYTISCDVLGERVQTSPQRDAIGNALARIDEAEREIDELIGELLRLRKEITQQIDDMEDEQYSDLLYKRYVQGISLSNISETINYSYRHITRLHGDALCAFERKYGHLYLDE